MLGSLYGDKGDDMFANDKPASASLSMAPTRLASRKAAAAPPRGPPKAPMAALQRLAAAGVGRAGTSSTVAGSPAKSSDGKGDAADWNVHDEYDPTKPNDYDEICKQRARKRTEADLKKRQEDLVQRQSQPAKAPEEPVVQSKFAMKMMKKMGWKEGSGLGKDQQGIAAPLIAQKTDANVARIVQSQVQPTARVDAVVPERKPSKVLLLLNLVGNGEVDDDLEEETADEARKFGTVKKCKIHQVPSLPDDRAVRIFLYYEQFSGAEKAQKDLNGRFFGGRVVRCSFFPEERFLRDDLDPGVDE